MCLADFADYYLAERRAEELYTQPEVFLKMSAMNISGAGIFAADRSIADYARDIWHTKPVE